MKITCQSCQSKYTVSDEKVQGKTVKIKCRKCGATILVNSGGATTSSANVSEVMPSFGAAEGAASYLVNVGDGDQRSMTMAEILAAYQTSVVTADTYVWADGMADWSPLGQVEAIVNALNSPEVEAPAAAAAPIAAEPLAAAPALVEAPRAAVAKRETSKRGQDLFGGGGGGEEVVASSPSYSNGHAARPAPAPSPSNVGAREENSMLFSLSALTAKIGSSPGQSSAPAAPRATSARDREDSGIIDLKALAAAAAVSTPAQSAAPSLLAGPGLFPLGAPAATAPVVAAPPVVSPSMPPAKSKTPLFLGGGAVVAIGAIVGAFVLMKGSPPPPPAPATSTTEATAASAAPTATATATASSAATDAPTDPSASPSASAASSAKVAAKTSGPRNTGGPPAAKGPASPPPAATPPPAAAPKKSSCGCAAGDLMCAMKCSAH